MNIGMLRTFEELEAVCLQWKQWQNHPNNDFEQFKKICRLRPDVESPFVVAMECNGLPQTLLVGRLEMTQFRPAIGYVTLLKIPARIMVVIHQGVLGQMDEKAATESVKYLWSLLCSGVADVLEFHYLSEDASLLKALQLHRPGWFCEKKLRWSTHWQMDLPAEGRFIECKLRAKHRTSIRKRERELEAAFPGKVAWRWMSRFDDIPGLCKRLEEVAKRAYQRGVGSGFIDNEEFRQRLALFAGRNQLRVQVLEIDGRVRAFWFGYLYHDVFHLSETGYDPVLSRYEVGTLMFIRLSDELSKESVRKLDFGIGDAGYKQRFGDRSWREGTVRLFAPTAKGVILRTYSGLFTWIDKIGRTAIQKLRVEDRLRTAWRRQLTPAKLSAGEKLTIEN